MIDRRDFLKFLALGGTGAALLRGNLASADVDADTDVERQATPNNTINILFDSWSSQVMFQREPYRYPSGVPHPKVTKRRLNTLLGAIKSYGLSTGMEWRVRFTKSRIKPKTLAGVDIYVSLTRYINEPNPPSSGTGFSYRDSELAALEDFVSQGGAVLLMTDHGATESIPNWTQNDAALASVFGVTLRNIFVTHTDPDRPDLREYMVMEMNPDLPEDLKFLSHQVAHISAHDSCIMVPPADFTPLALFPEGSTAYDSELKRNIDLPNRYYSILVPFGSGNVIVVGNSGMVGDYGSPDPAPGLISMENNLMFFLNCVSYLVGLTCIPEPGQGPC